MEKKLWPLLALLLALTACGAPAEVAQTPARSSAAPVLTEQGTLQATQVEATARIPTEEEVLGDYECATRVYGWFELAPLPDSGETVTVDGTVYRRVYSERLDSVEDLRLDLRGVFCEELTNRLLGGGTRITYRDIDGALYVTGEGRERSPEKGAVTVEAQQVDDTTFSVNVTVDLLDDREGAVTGMECWAFPYVLENGRWGFSDFRLVY